MNTILDSLPKWFSKRPLWLQIAATGLLQQTGDISELANLCQQEADGKLHEATDSFSSSAFSQIDTGNLRLCSISDVEGVNALAPKKPLEFGKGNITVVYGNNGSGKSGYVRILKHVCGAREPGTLHRNVFKPSSTLQKARISFEHNGPPMKHAWLGEDICDELNNVNIFDTSFGKIFVSTENEVSYEPPVLSFFSSLIRVCEKVAAKLDDEANRYQSRKPNMPDDIKTTAEGSWYESIDNIPTLQDIDKHCAFNSTDNDEMQRLQQRLTEHAPDDKAKKLRKQRQHIETLVYEALKYLDQLSEENCQRINAAKQKSILKKTAADDAAKKVFSDSKLEGIGSDVWKELWEAARSYSVLAAYKGTDCPNVSEGSRCVLCHQALTQEAKERLTSFENFVKNETQKSATLAKNEYENAILKIEELPKLETLKAKIDAAGFSQDEIPRQVIEFFIQLQKRRAQLLEINSEEEVLTPLPSPKWIEEANAHSRSLDELASKFDEDAKFDNREKIKKELSNLQARKWLSENRDAIVEEIERLKLLGKIQEAKKLANTKALSKKKGELSEALITNEFVQRFKTELKALGATQVNVELVKSKVSKGKVLHKLQLRGADESCVADILSEGENRIVSIAAFLADVTGNNNHAPFIFDDPISSLDQTYEEAVVQRLIELSQNNQVIIFTHRLSLLGTIRYFAEKKFIKPDLISIRSSEWGTGEPAHIPLSKNEIKTALNILIENRYFEAKKADENCQFEQAEILLKSMCSEFRTLVERSIENDLLCGVVQRFQRPVHTLNLKKLAKLKDSDCYLLDSLMTKYSGFEHSQPTESPVDLPRPDELRDDMIKLKNWREDFVNRSVS